MGEIVAVIVSAILIGIICWYAAKAEEEVQRTQHEVIKMTIECIMLLAEQKGRRNV